MNTLEQKKRLNLNVKIVSRKVMGSISTGIKLGVVLFIALNTVSMLNRAVDFVGFSLKKGSTQFVQGGLALSSFPRKSPEVVKFQDSNRQQPAINEAQVPLIDYRLKREKRMLVDALWNRGNQTLKTLQRLVPKR